MEVTTSPQWETLLGKLLPAHSILGDLEAELDAYTCAYLAGLATVPRRGRRGHHILPVRMLARK
jgi:hypothetical protein